MTVIDRLGAPGDALISANVIRCIKKAYPRIRFNCITPHPDLIKYDPNIDFINAPESFHSFDSSYWELIVHKEKYENIIAHNLKRLKITSFEYKSKFYLRESEKKWASETLSDCTKPILAICTRSKEKVKNWFVENWIEVIATLKERYSILHIGDEKEPFLNDVHRFAGQLTMRESAALLSKAKLFIGPDSLLMHVANGLNIPSVIIFGGSRPSRCFGYQENINLTSNLECSPCWIHDGYEECGHELKCLRQISTHQVLQSVDSLLNKN